MKKSLFVLFLIIIFATLFSGCSKDSSHTVPIKNGLLDLSAAQYQNSETIPLIGEWQFYWNEFVPFNQLDTRDPDLMADVPNSWIFHSLRGKPLDGKGYATYRLHVKTLDSKDAILSVKMPSLSSAYEMYIDDKLIASNGRIGKTESKEIPEYRPTVATFSVPSSEFDIIIYVSNFNYSHGGFWSTAYIGTPDEVISFQEHRTRYESTLMGALLVVSLFFFAVYLLNKEFKYALFFALTCLSLGVLLDMVGEMSLIKVFDIQNFKFAVWLWYSSIICFLMSLNLYLHILFPSKYSKLSLRFFVVYFVIIESVITFTSPVYYGGFAYITNYFEMSWLLNLVIIVCLGVWNKKQGGVLNLLPRFYVNPPHITLYASIYNG